MKESRAEPGVAQEDVWIHSTCGMCYGCCSIRAHRVNGRVVKLEGDPNSPMGRGRLCAKGQSGIMTLYDPNRVNTPLKRTNPEKGFGVDPGWQEISWEEALDTIATKLKEVREKDPRALFFQRTTTATHTRFLTGAFTIAFGTPNSWAAGGGLHCGNAAHLLNGLMHASWSLLPDFQKCEYAIYFGASKGHSAGHAANINAQMAADARARGMKMVVFDPMCNFAAAKATEWVPIRVGTDNAVALAMVNVLLNEVNIWDEKYLKHKTNAPYLIQPDGHYVRDAQGRPLIWDSVEGEAKSYNDPSIKDFALEGTHEVQGLACRPAFDLLREHVKKYTPEKASEISTVHAETIRRIATEFGRAARVGSTIVLDGKELPYRPVAAIYFRGSAGHKNAAFNCVSIELLNQICGAADVPGGALGFNPASFGYPESGQPYYMPREDRDGLMTPGFWLVPTHLPWPPREAGDPESLGLQELFPHGMISPVHASRDQEELWQRVKLPYRPQVLLNVGANSVMSVGNKDDVAESLKRIPFIASIDLFLNEFTDFADIVLPDVCYLEAFDPQTSTGIFNEPAGLGEWCWTPKVPAVSPQFQRRSFADVLLELADRIGILEGVYTVINLRFQLKPPYKLEGKQKYSWEEISDRIVKNQFGPERGLEWFGKNGPIKWPRKVEETYWRAFLNVRVPIYFESFKRCGEEVRPIAEKYGISLDYRHHEALPEWLPCPSHEVTDPQYDLWSFYYRDTLHTNSFTMENPWLDEASQMNPYSYSITINTETAKKKGIEDGDEVWVETVTGRRVKGRAKVSELIHPEGLGIGACAGHWSSGMPIAKGKGVFYNDLLELDLEHADPVSANLDLCAKVKVYKAR